MIKKAIVMVGLLCLLFGCVSSQEVNNPGFSVTDALSRTVNFSDLPTRIVIAGKQTPMLANFAYLFQENTGKINAIENRSQSADRFLVHIDESYAEKLVLEKGAGAEQIIPLDPDLVILKTVMKEQIGDQLELIGIPVVYVSLETDSEINRDLLILGTVFGDIDKAERLGKFYTDKKVELDKEINKTKKLTRILLLQVVDSEGETLFKVPPSNWLQTQMVRDLGGVPVWSEDTSGGGWMEVNVEQIFQWNPEIIVVINYQGKAQEMINFLQKELVWNVFLQENDVRIQPFPYDFISWDQPDPRWILGFTSLAHYFYPEKIDEGMVFETVNEFYTNFYGVEKDFIEINIISEIAQQINEN